MEDRPADLTLSIIESDEWLRPAAPELIHRHERYRWALGQIEYYNGTIADYANAHLYYGFHYDPVMLGWWFREWLPSAKEVFLFGDFNDWERTQYPLERDQWGCWSIFLSAEQTNGRLGHRSLVKLYIHGADGSWLDRIPAYIRRTVQDEQSKDFVGQVWRPDEPFDWQGDDFDLSRHQNLLIYECHVGMAQEEARVGSYAEFTANVLPRVKQLGYNTLQLMAIAEHPYYGSFGYQVSNFFAPSSRFGTPEELKTLIRTAHSMGLGVIMDVVHSHFVKNLHEGINRLDGTELYSPAEGGDHPQWDSKLFDYGREQVRHFLLSNLKYWITEFHFDGFRFDAVTSMLYHHHGLNDVWDREAYFGEAVNRDAILYLSLANRLVHTLRAGGITIAEDVSGMPGLTVPIDDGGVGFDYRLGMSIPDFWIEYLQDIPDEEWDLHRMWNTLLNRLPSSRTVAYAESHDQALVGDKTIAFRLMDKAMYDDMSRTSKSVVVDRGIALHKMIRLITITLGGEAYLNFMGNEFGHPEWIDFPRQGNGWSYAHARRQWSLAEAEYLRYIDLWRFDRDMLRLVQHFHILGSGYGYQLLIDDLNKTLVYEQAGLLFVFNWHPANSLPDYSIPAPVPGRYRLIFNSDHPSFGGLGRITEGLDYFTVPHTDSQDTTRHTLQIYNINRAALIFERQGE